MGPTRVDRFFRALLLALLTLAAASSSAAAHDAATGGASAAPARPLVEKLKCETGSARRCAEQAFLSLRGEGLDDVDAIVFLGARGGGDNLRAEPRRTSTHRVLLQVPVSAPSGRLRVLRDDGRRSRKSARIEVTALESAAIAPGTGEGVFPVAGSYDFGTYTNGFGGGRGHQGQDILTACGTPIVAASSGRVEFVAYHARAGHYAVIEDSGGESQAYMHLSRAPALEKGDRVNAGGAIGSAGRSGNATACMLHFELWTAPGWYQGGAAVDPRPELERWVQAASG